jgi:hypothetical protein
MSPIPTRALPARGACQHRVSHHDATVSCHAGDAGIVITVLQNAPPAICRLLFVKSRGANLQLSKAFGIAEPPVTILTISSYPMARRFTIFLLLFYHFFCKPNRQPYHHTALRNALPLFCNYFCNFVH